MFGFKLWSKFGSFKDPITITQNMTLSLPPKTTVGGMLAAILGIDYNDYFSDKDYFDFKYSLVLQNPVRKKSYAQNYVKDYTKKSRTRLTYMSGIQSKSYDDWVKSSKDFTKPKPIYRELLLNPSFFIFIENFKYEKESIKMMEKHWSAYPLYMGNSEFAASYQHIHCKKVEASRMSELDSFTGYADKINFEPGKKYTNIYAATRVTGNRQYSVYKNIVICNKKILLSSEIDGFNINTDMGTFCCEFI